MAESASTISQDFVVAMHYVLSDDSGTVIDQSPEGKPLAYLHGHQNIVPGLEAALTGTAVGETKKVVVPPAEGYGEREDQLVLDVERSQLPADLEPQIGMTLGMQTDQGHTVPVRVTAVDGDKVKLDANHELAGVTLHFEVKIDSVRPASAEELEHGHVHDGSHGH